MDFLNVVIIVMYIRPFNVVIIIVTSKCYYHEFTVVINSLLSTEL